MYLNRKGILSMSKSLQTVPLEARLLRLPQVLEIIPISKSTWWAGVASGKYPQPIKLGPKITCWRLSDLKKLSENGAYFDERSKDRDF
jgi:prophage regulatory protein